MFLTASLTMTRHANKQSLRLWRRNFFLSYYETFHGIIGFIYLKYSWVYAIYFHFPMQRSSCGDTRLPSILFSLSPALLKWVSVILISQSITQIRRKKHSINALIKVDPCIRHLKYIQSGISSAQNELIKDFVIGLKAMWTNLRNIIA